MVEVTALEVQSNDTCRRVKRHLSSGGVGVCALNRMALEVQRDVCAC